MQTRRMPPGTFCASSLGAVYNSIVDFRSASPTAQSSFLHLQNTLPFKSKSPGGCGHTPRVLYTFEALFVFEYLRFPGLSGGPPICQTPLNSDRLLGGKLIAVSIGMSSLTQFAHTELYRLNTAIRGFGPVQSWLAWTSDSVKITTLPAGHV